MIVTIKIRYARQAPASGQSWTVSIADPNIVTHIPNCRLARASVKKKEIRIGIIVKIIWHSGGPRPSDRGKNIHSPVAVGVVRCHRVTTITFPIQNMNSGIINGCSTDVDIVSPLRPG